MKLLVVESPAKAKTIKKYLGKDFEVAATMGHIKDLPKSKLGVDVENDYETNYRVIKGKKKTISKIKKVLPDKDSDVYLALDPDREGEAIAAHVAEELKLDKPNRVVFHEITKDAVKDAVDNPKSIDENLVDAQKARRILDRLVGYKLSELLWKKIWYGLSAGRVQSVATRLIVERERERQAFDPEEYWNVFANLVSEKENKFQAKLHSKDGDKFVPANQEEIDGLLKDLEGAEWSVEKIESKDKKKGALPPFITSTLQRTANNYLGFTAKSTMAVAQQLYQGISIKGKGQTGLITYMRTDSTNLASQAVKSMRKLIKKDFGEEYVPEKPNYFRTKSRVAQEAHEAIRPTDVTLRPDDIKDSLDSRQYKLYKLIWNRAVGCQMAPMKYKDMKITVLADSKKDSKYTFQLKAQDVIFDGYAKVVGSRLLKKDENVQIVSDLEEGEDLECKKIDTEQKFTKPRARYSEATLVKTLEKYGIGRPSTYANIISTIQARGYVGKEGKYLFPTDVGFVVNDFLVDHFEDIVDYDFTSEIEEDLDNIAEGQKDWVPIVDKLYTPFSKTLKKKDKEVKKEDVVILGESDAKCPECGGEMVVRIGRYGKFLSCAKFPECKGMLSLEGKSMKEEADESKYVIPDKCEECGEEMVLKRGKYGKFWACSSYPDCKNTMPMLLKEKCPECGENLVERKGKWGKTFTGCSGYPDCKYIKKKKKS